MGQRAVESIQVLDARSQLLEEAVGQVHREAIANDDPLRGDAREVLRQRVGRHEPAPLAKLVARVLQGYCGENWRRGGMRQESALDSRLNDRNRPLPKASSLGAGRARAWAQAPAFEPGRGLEPSASTD